jgi:hypothetical protein
VNNPDTSHVEPYPDTQAAYLTDWPVPYRLTPKAEALLAGTGPAAEASEPGPDPDREPEAGS